MATTEEVWNHHLESFGARDVAECLKDFTEDSLLIVNGEQHKGTEAIGKVFAGLFEALPAGCAFDLTHCTVLDDSIERISTRGTIASSTDLSLNLMTRVSRSTSPLSVSFRVVAPVSFAVRVR